MPNEPASPSIEVGPERGERLGTLLTLSHEPMLMWRLGGPIEFWNAGAERLYGFVSNEAVGRSSHAILQTKFPVDVSELHSQLRNERYWSGELSMALSQAGTAVPSVSSATLQRRPLASPLRW
jgi:PAS domain S-box-containing protein